MDLDSVPVDSGCDSVPGIPVTVPAEFEFRSEFCRNGNYNLAGTSAKFPFPRNSRNHLDSGGFHLEYMGDCKELGTWVKEVVMVASMVFDGWGWCWKDKGGREGGVEVEEVKLQHSTSQHVM